MYPSHENSSPAAHPNNEQPEFSFHERALLLKLAHESIASAIESREPPSIPPSPHLEEPRGVFTTLYHRSELRGCVGYALPIAPLYRAVMETARAAAFDDTRFLPLGREELPELEVSLSILSPLKAILPEDVAVGRHGLLISLGGRRGLLLPQVPAERGWDRITFLEQTCHKAGLPADAWRTGATIQAFVAEVFGDRDE